MKLLDDILAGKFRGGVVLVTYKERACRYGFELLEKVATFGDCQIIATEKEIESEDETADLTNDLVSIMTCFSAKIYGKRGGKSRRVELAPETITRMMELRGEGKKERQITDILNAEGFKTEKGNPISKSTVRRVCDSNGSERLVSAVARTASYVRKGTINPALWAKDNLIPSENGKVTLKEVGKAYRVACEKQGKEHVNNIALG